MSNKSLFLIAEYNLFVFVMRFFWKTRVRKVLKQESEVIVALKCLHNRNLQ